MIGVTTEPEAVYEPTEDEAEIRAIERYETCEYNDICDRACLMHSNESTWNWLRCEECETYEKEGK